MSPDLMLMVFSLVIVFFFNGYGSADNTEPQVNSTADLADSIRRQLMVNNYDYMSSESDDALPLHHHNTAVAEPAETDNGYGLHPDIDQIFVPRADAAKDSVPDDENNDPFPDDTNDQKPVKDTVNDFEPTNADDPGSFDVGESDVGESEEALPKTDLLYYVDDQRLNKANDNASRDYFETNSSNSAATSPQTKFKIFKARSGVSGRRSGGKKPIRRFVKEQGEEGLAIIKLDNEPFPEFRLPSGRRQYMRSDPEAEMEIDLPDNMSDEMVREHKDTFGDV